MSKSYKFDPHQFHSHKRPQNPSIRNTDRPWRPRPGTPQVVADYLVKAGLTEKMPKDQSTAYMQRRFDRAAVMNPAAVRLAVHSQMCGEQNEVFLAYFASLDLPQPKRVLRLGYDLGVEACFFAEHFPNAEVIGLEEDRATLECASKLAAELKLRNVRFFQASLHTDLRSFPNALKNQTFDLVVAHHITNDTVFPHPVRCIEEATAVPVYPNFPRYARHLASLLTDNGTLLSLETIPVPIDFARWTWALHDAGIHVDRSKTVMASIQVPAFDEVMRTPLFAGSKRVAEPLTPDEMREFWLADWDKYGPEVRRGGAVAEAIFVSTNPKEFLHGFRYHTLHGPIPYCVEIWQAGSELVRYMYANGGTALWKFPVAELPTLIEELRADGRDRTEIRSFEEYGPAVDPATASGETA